MPQVKLSERDAYEFQHSLQVRPQDVNYGGHLGNDNLITLVGAARAYLFHSLGFTELKIGEPHVGIIITDMVVNYRGEGFMFDELLVETHFDEFVEKGFRLFHRVRKDTRLIALVETGILGYNYETKKTAPIPAPFLKSLNK